MTLTEAEVLLEPCDELTRFQVRPEQTLLRCEFLEVLRRLARLGLDVVEIRLKGRASSSSLWAYFLPQTRAT